ncbi:quinoprotein dehydrogenase-associated SoxYZ-like carrier [Methylobacterium gnaphalii]|uniref:Quinoprotein dehydrogenase-associated SoxYZ-like carrier n=1 Tax=Methylobacterium gnaphalii TaxID=1010610 RepID=A0A512JFM9_9HYPH|nr:quinoprotein dehydrogenase-associated SoxYZ-like carrier [Methylobacterium gnaphalii]GEP08750.1 quinoprotein dehydrogenase-associated SoxYZ-like carrier [Methylobacterium gnaphalii]GJD69340.1 hypothetical protein MMMDOFMJ_2270 [Methylobacterium gnaphalii]GLS47516.1 quinoprotein dehydrogenase-associated SoxYZ-like carrier [Methylobacterium gnaphalii]
MKALILALGLSLSATALTAGTAYAAGASDTDQERAERWNDLKKELFAGKTIEPSETMVKIDAPKRAEDAALVPITLTMPEKDKVKSVSLVIDDNPTPYAAHFTFGPAADPGEIKLRVRINNYTNVHAVTETTDGKFYESVGFVKASGGCSAPMGMSDEEAMKGMGEMRMKFSEQAPGKPAEATLMIRHPNFSGMQMNQVSRDYTPARFIEKLEVTYGDKLIFHMDGDISISSNPVIGFGFKPEGKGPIKVAASDNQGGKWQHTFQAPSPSN